MASNWALPRTIIQYSEPGGEDSHVSWLEIDNFSSLKFKDGKHVRTTRDLLHIARDPKTDIKEKTYFLKLTNFNFENMPANISGIEVKITMNRFGRITDDTVKLTLNGNEIGDNLADLDLQPIKTYGNSTELWNTSLSASNNLNSTFGIILRFQSHPRWPHKASPLVDTVEIRLH